jgi:hypothetical protein
MLTEIFSTSVKPNGNLSWKQKLTLLLGREPQPGSLEYNKKALELSSLEESAKDIYQSLIKMPVYSKKAKKLGLA